MSKEKEIDDEKSAFEPESVEVDLSKLEPFTNSAHQWHQEGGYLICDSCSVRHAAFIGIDKVLKGFDDQGKPIIEKRW